MNVYVIYKFSDTQEVNELLEEYKKRDEGHLLNFFKFDAEGANHMWHRKAKRKMQSSNLVVYFCGFDGTAKGEARNVKWELELANKYKKRVYIFNIGKQTDGLDVNNGFAKTIFGTDYSEGMLNINKYRIFDDGDHFETLLAEAKWSIDGDVINHRFDKEKLGDEGYYNLLLEEYKIMVDTSERLMERRQNTSNLYTTLCAALVAAVGASFAFNNWWVVACIAFGVGIVFICLSVNWRSCLKAYEMNNTGKFAVINAIEKILPADLFDSEYRYNTKNGIRSYSGREKILPIIFVVFGVVLIVFGAVLIVLNAAGVV